MTKRPGNDMYKIRKMNIEDYAAIVTLWKNTPGIRFSEEDDSRKAIKLFLEKNPHTCFVAEHDGAVMGTIMGGSDGRRGHIYHLMVSHEYRNNGIGKKLLDKTEREFRREGISKIFLLTFRKNRTGNRFWNNNGYGIRTDLYYRDKKID